MNRPRTKRGAGLTGAWSGIYSYPGDAQKPVAFSAHLTQKGRWIVGTTKEIAEHGEAKGTAISATLQGLREGAGYEA